MHHYALSLHLQVLWGFFLTFAPILSPLCYQSDTASQAGTLGKEKCLSSCQNHCPGSLAKPGFQHVPCAAHALSRQVTDYLRAFIQQGWVLLSGVLFPSFAVADVAASNFLCLLWGENNQICAFKQLCAETSSVCSSASQTPEHPWMTETLINGAAVLARPTPLQV